MADCHLEMYFGLTAPQGNIEGKLLSRTLFMASSWWRIDQFIELHFHLGLGYDYPKPTICLNHNNQRLCAIFLAGVNLLV